jgi:pimeloyl-ACP methyl ester carboxylesterase
MTDAAAPPPVLLLHGFATSAARTWGENGWIDILKDMGRTVLAPDLLGHGTAPKPHDPAAYAGLRDHVAEGLPDGPVDAIGFSLGARTLVELAIDRPDRFRRLVLSGVGANLFRNDGSGAIAQAVRGGDDGSNPVARYFADLAAHPDADPEALAALMEAPGRRLAPEDLAVVACPTLVVLGDADFAGPPDPLVDALPDARLVVLPRTDHFATPKSFKFMDAALGFLEETG